MPPSSMLAVQIEVHFCRGTLGRWGSWRYFSPKFREFLHKRQRATSPVWKTHISREEGVGYCKWGRLYFLQSMSSIVDLKSTLYQKGKRM